MTLRSPALLLSLLMLLTAAARAEPLRVITVGDSITRGVRPDVNPEQTFAALVQKALVEKGITAEISNAGIGGDTAAALKRLQDEVIAKKPHLVTIMYGTNDSYVTRGQTESRHSLAEYESALRAMIAALKQAGIQPVLMTSPPWAEGARPDGLNQHPNVRLIRYVEVCRAVAKDLHVPLVDHFAHWSALANTGVKLNDWTSDFCHPNPRGHQELARAILRLIEPLAKAIASTRDAGK